MRSLIMIIFIVFTANIYSQSNHDLLNQKIGTLKIENFNQLQDSGLISKMDMTLLSMYMVRMQQNGVPFDNLTFRQILDSLEVFKQNMNAEISASANFGTDSVFLRTPNQEKVFIGMGQLSLENWLTENQKNCLKPTMIKD